MAVSLPLVPTRFCPSKETLAVLNGRVWIASYSRGKDSTGLVTWLEYLRRVRLVTCDKPRLVCVDTGVEYPFLTQTGDRLMDRLTECGWECEVVCPAID